MRLFKFVETPEAVLHLAQGSLKFARIPDLNDPMELLPVIDETAIQASLARLRSDGFSAEQFAWLGCQQRVLEQVAPEVMVLRAPTSVELANSVLRSAAYDDRRFMTRQHRTAVELIRSRVGVLSLTARYDSFPMWAHYARNARGFVVRFDSLDAVFAANDSGSLHCLKPVHYFDSVPGMTFDPQTQDNLFFSKLQDWRYEQEWRVVLPLADCRETAPNLFLRSVPQQHVTGVLCGWQASSADIERLEAELPAINSAVQVSRSSLDGGTILPSQADFA